MPHKSDSNCHEGVTLSPSPPMCLPTRTVLLFLVSLLSIFVGILFCKAIGPGHVTGRGSSGYDSGLSLPRPDLNLWPGTETLLQAAAG